MPGQLAMGSRESTGAVQLDEGTVRTVDEEVAKRVVSESGAGPLTEASPGAVLPTTAGRGSSRIHSKFSRLQWSQTGYVKLSAHAGLRHTL